jgi:uncharacterized coiled-coil DUF342 family protein
MTYIGEGLNSSDLLDMTIELKTFLNQLTKIKKNRDFLEKERLRWLQKNSLLNKEQYRLTEKIYYLKTQRDNENKNIQILKKRRNQIKNKLKEKHNEIKNYRSEIKKLQNNIPHYSDDIKQLIKKLEWNIQTNPLSLEKEKKMIKKIQILEKDLHIDNQIKMFKKNIMKIKAEIETLKTEVNTVHFEILELSEKSQGYHENYIELIKKNKLMKSKSKTSLKELVNIKEDLDRNRSKSDDLSKQINKVEQKIIAIEKKRKLQKINKKRIEVEEIAQNKLKKKKKLSFGELKILMEEDVL